MFNFNFAELFSNMESRLLEKARNMEKMADPKDIDKPITQNIDVPEDNQEGAENSDLPKYLDPNTVYEIDGNYYETDDNGNIYKTNGELNDDPEEKLEIILKEYFDDLRKQSEYPETIPYMPFEVTDLKLRVSEENAEMREDFDEIKADLKRQWEEANGKPWPKYDHDVYSSSGKLIRKAGNDYDAHHIQPLGMGGDNDAKNITPLSAEVHYDKQGVHSANSPYSRIEKALGGNSND